MENWPFEEPRNVAVITVRQIIKDGQPILLVSHDAEDEMWQFLPDSVVKTTDAMVVTLEEVCGLDTSVQELADLPLGWQARRPAVGEPWQRSKKGQS